MQYGRYMRGNLYFGIAGVWAPDYSSWEPAKNRGTVVFDENFNITTPEAQQALLELCGALEVEDCIPRGESERLEVCSRPPHTLVSTDTVSCFLRDFKEDRIEEGLDPALPTGLGFYDELYSWLQQPGNGRHFDNVGFVNGTINFVRVPFRYTAQVGIPVAPMRQIFDRSKQFLTTHYTNPPPTLGSAFFHTGYFSWLETSEELVNVVISGFYVLFPCAFVILIFATGSIVLSAAAVVTVGLITGSLLGFMKIGFGFALGISEAIAGCMVIGLSIDYTLHLSHAYIHASSATRDGKVVQALTVMGITVIAGAFTTLGSALCMLPCQLTFFLRMCKLIAGTIGFSLLYALFFFMPLLALIGPSGKSKSILERLAAPFAGSPRSAAVDGPANPAHPSGAPSVSETL